MNNAYGNRGERVQDEAGQGRHKAKSQRTLNHHFEEPNTSMLANGSADQGRKRFSVNLVFCPG